jgi:imidazolonepropionase-like amidohydrolase
MKIFLAVFASLMLTVQLTAQTTFQTNGVVDNKHTTFVFTNATIYVDYQTRIENATMVVKDGAIVQVGSRANIPNGAIVHDLKGKTIYPSFIDLYSNYGMPEIPKGKRSWGQAPQLESKKTGAHNWNETIKPEVDASTMFGVDDKKAKALRDAGFGVVMTHQQDGIMRGASMITSLANQRANACVVKVRSAMQLSFKKGVSKQNYPSSQMGAIALLRQTYYDAKWHAGNPNVEQNISLDAVIRNIMLPQIFEVKTYLEALRADKVGDEFGVQYIFKGAGDEYKRIAEIQKTGATFIVPVNFPSAYDVEDAYAAFNVSLADMKHWELAPTNAAVLHTAAVPFVFTASGLKEPKAFLKNVKKAVGFGLPPAEALKAMTLTPATLMGIDDQVGALRAGLQANFIITDGDIFEKGKIQENWVQGQRFVMVEKDPIDVRGKYDVLLGKDLIYHLTITGSIKKLKGSVEIIKVGTEKTDTVNVPAAVSVIGRNIAISFSPNDAHYQGALQAAGSINFDSGLFDGNVLLPDGTWSKWNAVRKKKTPAERDKGDKGKVDTAVALVSYPSLAYGFTELPDSADVLISNATVWTNEEPGILQNTDVLIRNGKIVAIGSGVTGGYESLTVIDGTGMHLTAGIIDEHSHIAISNGVNEGTQSISAEVSIADVINSDDVNIYRQLAGGVTSAQLLHGSANPIGGQSAIIKLRWGQTPEAMKFNTEDGFIKFALGENVKQSNWGDNNQIRYPQSRMGVEQVFYDAFLRARAYEAEWDAYNDLPKKQKAAATEPRVDLELKILLEILKSERFVTCHSYVQSEINMLPIQWDSH